MTTVCQYQSNEIMPNSRTPVKQNKSWWWYFCMGHKKQQKNQQQYRKEDRADCHCAARNQNIAGNYGGVTTYQVRDVSNGLTIPQNAVLVLDQASPSGTGNLNLQAAPCSHQQPQQWIGRPMVGNGASVVAVNTCATAVPGLYGPHTTVHLAQAVNNTGIPTKSPNLRFEDEAINGPPPPMSYPSRPSVVIIK